MAQSMLSYKPEDNEPIQRGRSSNFSNQEALAFLHSDEITPVSAIPFRPKGTSLFEYDRYV